jgi:hypothetical protein
MPEPLTFKIITDADDSGIRKYDRSMEGLNVSSRKASSALNSFSRELLQAKSGADVASAGAESLAHVFHQGIAGALVIGGFKIVSDQIKAMGEMIHSVGEETASAVKQLQRMGEPGNLQDAVKGADMLDQKLDAVTKKLEGIKGGNFFSKFLSDVTGSTAELEKTQKTIQLMVDSQLALGFATEKQNALRTAGVTDEQKSIEAINQKYLERVKIAERITDANARAGAMEDIQAIKSAETYDLKTKLLTKQEDQLNKITDTNEKLDKAREASAIKGGQIAQLLGAAGGSARGPGQRKTSFEIGMERNVAQAKLQQTKISQENAMFQIAKKIGATTKDVSGKEVISDRNKVQNALIAAARGGAQVEVAQKYKNDQVKAVQDATKSQTDAYKAYNETTQAVSQLNGVFVKTDKTLQDLNTTIEDGAKNMELFNKATSGGLSAESAAGVAGKSDSFGEMAGVLVEIYEVLSNTLDELKTYAHAA